MLPSGAALALCRGLGFGALSGLGRPGFDFAPAYVAGLLGLAHGSMSAQSLGRALSVAIGWGVGLGVTCALGTYSWGLDVVAFLVLSITGYLGVSFGLLSRCYRTWSSSALVFVHALCAWALWCWAWEDVVIGIKPAAMALVRSWPAGTAGARLVGTNVIEAVIIAGVVGSAHAGLNGSAPAGAAGLAWARRTLGRSRPLWPLAASLALLGVLGAAAELGLRPSVGKVSVGIPQINVESAYYTSRLSAPETAAAFQSRLGRLLEQLQSPELIVFSEGFDGAFPWALEQPRRRWQDFAAARRQSLLLTSYGVSPRGWKQNVIGAIRRDGSVAGAHVKVDLAPFGEAAFDAGDRFVPLAFGPELRVGALICQESVLPHGPRELTRSGATLLAVSTSDVTFGSSVTPFEHLAATQLRAIEVGRAVVWSSNGGPSAIIDRFGKIGVAAPFRTPAALIAPAELHTDLTPFLQSERLWPSLCTVYLLGSLLWRKQRQGRASPQHAAPQRAAPEPWRPLLQCALLVTFAVAHWFSSPALVEARQGDARRSSKALADLVAPKEPLVTQGLSRFEQPSSARAAVRYFIEYYGGHPELSAGVQTSPANLEQLQRELLALGLATTLMDFTTGVPRVASLTMLRDGNFAVSVHANGSGPVVLALPHRGLVSELPLEQLAGATVMRGLVPAQH